jgi:predicted ATPase
MSRSRDLHLHERRDPPTDRRMPRIVITGGPGAGKTTLLHEAAPLADLALRALIARYPYASPAFVLPPWGAIYTTGAERDQTFADAARIHDSIAAWYRRCGCRLRVVPPGPVQCRARRVLVELVRPDVPGPRPGPQRP